jgi:hypothetical protein
MPSVSNAQLNDAPDETETAFVIPETVTGVALLTVVPFPSCPRELLPGM